LLAKNAPERLGAGPNADRDIKNHAFYRRVDWDKMANRDVQPPFKPRSVFRRPSLVFDLTRQSFKLRRATQIFRPRSLGRFLRDRPL